MSSAQFSDILLRKQDSHNTKDRWFEKAHHSEQQRLLLIDTLCEIDLMRQYALGRLFQGTWKNISFGKKLSLGPNYFSVRVTDIKL